MVNELPVATGFEQSRTRTPKESAFRRRDPKNSSEPRNTNLLSTNIRGVASI